MANFKIIILSPATFFFSRKHEMLNFLNKELEYFDLKCQLVLFGSEVKDGSSHTLGPGQSHLAETGQLEKKGALVRARRLCPQHTPGQPPWFILWQNQLVSEVLAYLSPTYSLH